MYGKYGKRLLDLVVALTALIVLSPLFLVIGLIIRVQDGGPALFRQQRVGKYGEPFTLLKFRSMPVNTAEVPAAEAQTLTVTPVGTLIRRTNIDELPQLINVLRGEMSIVGPRPALAKQVELCAMRAERGVHRCAPGLTGLAQVYSYTGMSDAEKVEWDCQYCSRISFLGDVLIMIRTLRYLLSPPPTY